MASTIVLAGTHSLLLPDAHSVYLFKDSVTTPTDTTPSTAFGGRRGPYLSLEAQARRNRLQREDDDLLVLI